MKIIDNVSATLGEDIKVALGPSAKLKIAASTFSIYAFEALHKELKNVDSLQFILTEPVFATEAITDAFKKEQREFHIPNHPQNRESLVPSLISNSATS